MHDVKAILEDRKEQCIKPEHTAQIISNLTEEAILLSNKYQLEFKKFLDRFFDIDMKDHIRAIVTKIIKEDNKIRLSCAKFKKLVCQKFSEEINKIIRKETENRYHELIRNY